MPNPSASPLLEPTAHQLAQILYRCLEEIGTTKAALYLALDSTEGFHLSAHYGWPRHLPPPAFLRYDDPLLLLLQGGGQPLLAGPTGLPPALATFAEGSDQAQFLLTPILDDHALIGVLMQRDRVRGQAFEPARDGLISQGIVSAIRHVLTGTAQAPMSTVSAVQATPIPLDRATPIPLAQATAVPPAPVPPEHSPEVRATVPPAARASVPLAQVTAAARQSEPTQTQGLPRAVRRGAFHMEQRVFFQETARLLGTLVSVDAVALWMGDAEEIRPALVFSRDPLSMDAATQVRTRISQEVPSVDPAWVRLQPLQDFPDAPPVDSLFQSSFVLAMDVRGSREHDLLLLFRREGRSFTDTEQAYTAKLARLLSLHLQEARLHDQYHRAFLGMGHGLLTSMDSHREHLQPHSISTARMARLMALRLDLPGAEVEATSLAALLHDVGTLMVDPKLLLKAQLSEAERRQVQQHPLMASTYLDGFHFPFDVLRTIRHHHERWDGTGYPDGLSGEDIPLGSRIISLVEAYEVMATGRPYQDPKPLAAIVEELKRESGRQFDPRLVPMFLEVLAEQVQAPRG